MSSAELIEQLMRRGSSVSYSLSAFAAWICQPDKSPADIPRQARQNGAALALKYEHPATIAYRDRKFNSHPYPSGYTSSS